jgi:hypothetical protein
MGVKVWNGSAWVESEGAHVWDGASWVRRRRHYWNGSAWVPLDHVAYFTPSDTNGTRNYWGNSDSIDAFRAWWAPDAGAYSLDNYDDTWGAADLWQGRRTLSSYSDGAYYVVYGGSWYESANDGAAPIYSGSAFGCMADFVECDSSGNILGTSIAEKLSGKVDTITGVSMRLSRYDDGYGTQNVQILPATILAIPTGTSHENTSYTGLAIADSMGEDSTKWCFISSNIDRLIAIVQWLVDDKVICIHYGQSETSHYYGTNGGAAKRPILKVTYY